LEVQYQGGGTLGYKSVEQFSAVEDGAVQSAVTVLPQQGGVDPMFELSSLPFIAQTPDEAFLLWQVARKEYDRIFDDYGMVLLWAVPSPPSGIHAKMPITSADALKGLRIRSYDANSTRTLTNAGAAPLQIAWSDLTPQLSTGGIDALLTSGESAEKLTLWDYVSDFTELNYAMALSVAHVNKDAYNALSDADKVTLAKICAECDTYNWGLMRASVDHAYEVMATHGMTATRAEDVPQEVFELLKDAARPVTEKWLEETGERGAAILKTFEEAKA
jgi:TRAP-type C4-dicarboxylate transport system substrate-binding protein